MSDGITHINIYSKGKTLLGRNLSNFCCSPIETVDGRFESIEGYWYWLCTERVLCPYERRESLRTMSGFGAKALGRELRGDDWRDDPEFKLKIYNAMLTKLILHRSILKQFLENKLPFRHYYQYAGKIIEPAEGKWLIDMWTFLQGQLCS